MDSVGHGNGKISGLYDSRISINQPSPIISSWGNAKIAGGKFELIILNINA
jgi:hypothetical protein